MAWLLPILAIGASLIGQNVQNKAAQKNNDQQQQAQAANSAAAIAAAKDFLAPWLSPGAAPFAGALGQMGNRPAGPQPGSAFAQAVMNVGGGPASYFGGVPGAQGPTQNNRFIPLNTWMPPVHGGAPAPPVPPTPKRGTPVLPSPRRFEPIGALPVDSRADFIDAPPGSIGPTGQPHGAWINPISNLGLGDRGFGAGRYL